MNNNKSIDRFVLSLFSFAGIGELGLKASGFRILLSNELLQNRCALYQENYPETKSLCGDIYPRQRKQHSQFCPKCMDSYLIRMCQAYLYTDKEWN